MNNDFKFLTQKHMVCFRHKINKEKSAIENRLAGIFDKKPTFTTSDLVIFSDPPIEPGNDKILQEYKRSENDINLPASVLQDFNIKDTIILMEKHLSAAIEKSHQILEAAKGINISQKRDLLSKTEKSGKKLSIEEIYILSQKNLAKTLDNINERSRLKKVKESRLEAERQQEESKVDEQVRDIQQDLEPEPTKDSTKNANTQQSSHAAKESKPLFGLKRTANMMSKIFGADKAKQKVYSKIQKQYEEVENYVFDLAKNPDNEEKAKNHNISS